MSNWIFLNFEFFLLYLDSLKRIFKEQVTFSKFWVSWDLSFFEFFLLYFISLWLIFKIMMLYILFLIKHFHKTGLIFYSYIFIIFNEQHIFLNFECFFSYTSINWSEIRKGRSGWRHLVFQPEISRTLLQMTK